MALTPQQQAAVDFIVHTSTHGGLLARAGTGKSFTIVEMVTAAAKKEPRAYIQVCAFNKPIQMEMEAKIKKAGFKFPQVQVQTAHAMGFGLVRQRYTDVKVDDNKVANIIKIRADKGDIACVNFATQIAALVSFAKIDAVGFFDHSPIGDYRTWVNLADAHNLNDVEETDQLDMIIVAAQEVYKESLAITNVVDYSDMILFPLIKNIAVKYTKNYIFVDEAQDLGPAKSALIRKFLARNGRIMIVGDDRQSIYQFAGASCSALSDLILDFNATILPLNVTFRCPKKVVELVNSNVPDFTAHPDNIDGEILFNMKSLPVDFLTGYACKHCSRFMNVTSLDAVFTTVCECGKNHGNDWEPRSDAILCRNTAPLMQTAYALIKKKIPCKVEGKEIGKGLKNLALRWKVKSLDALLKKLDTYAEREIQKANAKNKPAKAEAIRDQVDSLVFVINEVLLSGRHDVASLISDLDNLFGDQVGNNVVLLATYHRSKGREWHRVYLLNHSTLCPSKYARKEEELKQESNLEYVAETRTKHVLGFLELA